MMANPMYGQNKYDAIADNQTQVAVSKEQDLTDTAGVYPVISIPAGTYVLGVQILVTSAITAGSMDIDIGDGDDADRYADAWAAATGALAVGSVIDCPCGGVDGRGVTSGRYYAAADTIDIDINTVASAGKVKLLVHCTNLGGVAPASLAEAPVNV
jgi:hypothetical protein